MSIPTFDSILKLIDEHGEPKNCGVTNCKSCEEILFARKFYSGKEGNKKVTYRPKSKFRYIAIDEHGKESIFHKKVDLIRFVRTSDKMLKKYINTDKSYKGYVMYMEKVAK